MEAGILSNNDEAAPDRLLIEIVDWDYPLHVGVAPASVPADFRFQGGLFWTRSIEVSGRVLAPNVHSGKSVGIWISTFGAEHDFSLDETGPDHAINVGSFYRPESNRTDFEVRLLLPRDTLPSALTGLASVWRFMHVWLAPPRADQQDVIDFAFSRTVHKNLAAWAGMDAP